MYVHRYTGIHVCVCVCVCAHACVHAHVCVTVCVTCVHCVYVNDWIMILEIQLGVSNVCVLVSLCNLVWYMYVCVPFVCMYICLCGQLFIQTPTTSPSATSSPLTSTTDHCSTILVVLLLVLLLLISAYFCFRFFPLLYICLFSFRPLLLW